MSPGGSLPGLLRDLKLDPAPLFAGLSFGVDDVVSEASIPFSEAVTLLDRCAQASGRPEFGLLLGHINDHRCLGPLGELIESAPTLGQAIADNVGYQGANSSAACAYLIPMGDLWAFGFGIYDRHMAGAEQIYAIVLATSVNMVRAISGRPDLPLEVLFSFAPPPQPGRFEQLLRAPVRFNQPLSCILLGREAMAARNPHADSAHRPEALARMRHMLRLNDKSVADRLRHQLRPSLSLGETSLAQAARRLGLSSRSLDRHLKEEGTTFQSERDRVRHVMACELLALTELQIGEIALALSYASHSGFTRSFQRWSGESPSAWRARHTPIRQEPARAP
ncbi:AraC family transcriptional regulator ligand-binding domain-containing protein [Aquabacter sp. L1I39]|uniref:AraC family transcriptional regulator n=1 Tax=Aquabacter sp. L1I39 TaxID=2820278 RepID=UPI001ADD21DE|nr:AraC family transcriptional regulator [Aquabacter sp. L1I39]QTL05644.1 AraC family transcriptional regulator ligand-binding domain-containing protein [Aquabacter sp. L1I39]